MPELSCSCTINKNVEGVGEFTAFITQIHSLTDCMDGVGSIESPNNSQKCDFSTSIVESEGSGPLYNITLQDGFEHLEVGDTATIQHSGYINPDFSLFPVGGESVWFSPKLELDDIPDDVTGNVVNVIYNTHIADDEQYKDYSYFTTYLDNNQSETEDLFIKTLAGTASSFETSDTTDWSASTWLYLNPDATYGVSGEDRDLYKFKFADIYFDLQPNFSDENHRVTIIVEGAGGAQQNDIDIEKSYGWINVIISYNSATSSASLYINNELIGSYTQVDPGGVETGISIVSQLTSNRSKFRIDDIRFFKNKILTPAERTKLHRYRSTTGITLNTYEYEIFAIRNKNGCDDIVKYVTLEFIDGDNGDINIDEFCLEETTVIVEADQCTQEVTQTTCTPNAIINFCYTTERPSVTYVHGGSSSLDGVGSIGIAASTASSFTGSVDLIGVGEIQSRTTSCIFVKQGLTGVGDITSRYIDKYYGTLPDFVCVDKLYPIADDTIDGFVNSNYDQINLYSYIDEGVYEGSAPDGALLSDDVTTFIQPSSIHTEGTFRYKFEVTKPSVIPEESRLIIRASAPTSTYESTIPPIYNISGIKLEDKFGNLIVQYEDLVFVGDSNRDSDSLQHNFTSLFAVPIINNAAKYEWNRRNAPKLNEADGYTLSLTVTSEEPGKPFTFGFDFGFAEDNTYEGEAILPSQSIRISAIEICNSGKLVTSSEDYLPVYFEVPATGRRIQKCFYPTLMPLSDFDTGVNPVLASGGINTWYSQDSQYSNATKDGAEILLKSITDNVESRYIINHDVVNDSGKLALRFGHTHLKSYKELQDGSFGGAFDQNLFGAYFSPSGAFNTKNEFDVDTGDSFFVVDQIKLKVLAKKTAGTDDYVLDVVGYSDDCLLNVTSPVCGFLQNVSGVTIGDPVSDTTTFYGNEGTTPVDSGFGPVDDLAFDGEAISDKDQYYEKNRCDDHYKLTTYPVVNSTEFRWYEIPLKIYDDNVELGKSRNYNMSSLLERLYLDIYPLPSGAAISNIHLCVTYKPQDGLNIITQGGEKIGMIQDGRTEGSYYPTSRQSNDSYLNAGSGYHPLSFISGIPHAYTSPTSLKTNYSRRWRGMIGLTQGPYDVNQFSFAFENPHLDTPLVDAFFDFADLTGTQFTSKYLGPSFSQVQVDFNQNGSTVVPETFENVGLRLTSGTMFETLLPGYSGNYRTADWTSLSSGIHNFESHPLYGKIFDGYSDLVRFNNKSSLQITNVDASSGICLYVRFIPDASVSGYDYFNSSNILSVQDTPLATGLSLGYVGGYLAVSGNGQLIQDTIPYSGYQYPLSVLVTYNDNHDRKLRLYTDNELTKGTFDVLRATSNPVDILTASDDLLYVGFGEDNVSGLPMLVSELGYSTSIIDSGCNIVESNPDRNLKEITAQEFFDNQRVKFFDPSESHTNDTFKLWDYVNENTYEDWQIGDFKYCEFSPAFSIMQKRTGRDLINFHIHSDGEPYFNKVNMTFPSNIDSGVSYHSQIENDFIRFHMSDTPDNFYSTYKRISKNLPAGYKFAEKAMVVETVLEHKTDNDIVWEDGSIGPKLIVSLYTKNKDPYYADVQPNLGLINRVVHHIEPSSCFVRLDTKFTHDSICDESEEWSIFPTEARLTEFKEKYFSKDVDDMFVQYDLSYPSGTAYKSDIYIHTSHVRAEDAFVHASGNNNNVNLFASGNPSPIDEPLNLLTASYSGIQESGLSLYTTGPVLIENSGLFMFTSGEFISTDRLSLFLNGYGEIKESGFNLLAIGDGRSYTGNNDSLNLFIYGKDYASGILPLTVINTFETNVPESSGLDLFLFATENSGIRNSMPLYAHQEFTGGFGVGPTSDDINLVTLGANALLSRYENESLSLSIVNDQNASLFENMNLTLYGDNFSEVLSSDNVNLAIINYTLAEGSPYVYWYNENYGTGIELKDEVFTTLDADDEIRGVDLFGYGSCTGNSPDKAIDQAIITDDTVWREETCNEGGIFRATATYTNLDVGYSGDYYGIRKYTGLTPNASYFVQLNIRTGSTEPIKTPRNWEEWGYGVCGPDTIGDCCPDDCETNINFSGVKLLGDYPYLSGDASITAPSGRLAYDNYGQAVSVNKDLMAVGSPKHQLIDEEGNVIDNAGAIFVYRRGQDVAGLQAPWQLEEKLTLPSGYKKDYISKTTGSLLCYPNVNTREFCISGQKWNIGQEGRELGSSLDIAYSGDRQVIVAGAPKAAWSRNFDTIVSSGIPVGMIVFTDKFSFNNKKLSAIHNTTSKYDILYKYFSAPWDFGYGQFQPKLDIRLLICHVHDSDQIDEVSITQNTVESLQEDWFAYQPITNLLDSGRTYPELLNEAVSGIKNKFFELFPRNETALYSGVPAILGVFGDDTFSTNNTASYSGAMVEFLDFYKDFAYESGVVDLQTGLAESGYINRVFSDAFAWDNASVEILEQTLTTGNLIAEDALKYITSGVGQEWAQENAYEFQIPPASGGRVFIFEKEDDKFNLIQELISPDEDLMEEEFQQEYEEGSEPDYGTDYIQYGKKPNDRFGHSVSISENGEVVAVGSPLSKEACRIYERDESENTRMYNRLREWLVFRGKTAQVSRYDQLNTASGQIESAQQVYSELNQTDKYFLRSDKLFWGNDRTIQLYKKVFDYHYDDIEYQGTWKFILNEFAGTSRLGYSSAVSEDGDIVAFGAPTDSFNEFEDSNVWYEQEDTWASYTNAGAVRVFESRKYHPHNKAVEFTKFGNIDRSVHATGNVEQFYDQMGLYFDPANIPFEKTSFDEIEIPKEAGLAFIITPEIDAASDEIIDNIKTWLSYGDRTLVLVGNDPVWEDNGLYSDSNEIINKILTKLGCRMRIVAARNEYESLQGCVTELDVAADKYNIIESFIPEYSHETHVKTPRMFAKGVADIKLDISDLGLEDLHIKSPCDDENTKCELPIKHMGDLRAQWNSACAIITDNGSAKVEYKTNWPFHFDNINPAQSCSYYPEIVKPEIRRPDEDARPLLVGAEYIQPEPVVIPATSGTTTECTTSLSGYRIETIVGGSYTTYNFADTQESNLEFLIQEGSGSIISGVYSDFTRGQFFDPDEFNGRDGLLQAGGTSYFLDPVQKTRKVSDESVIATEETYYAGDTATTSKVFIMASMLAETAFSLGKRTSGDTNSYNPNNDDQNIVFYNNLVMKDCNTNGNIDQIGGWTGRTSFTSAFADSRILNVFSQGNHTVNLNVEYGDSEEIKLSRNIVWIANPVNKPSDRDIQRIKTWLGTGNKRLVITYSNDQQIANNIAYICDQLNLNTKPFYLDGEDRYFVQDSEILMFSNQQTCCPIESNQGSTDVIQLLDEQNSVIEGCANGYGFNFINSNTAVEKLAIIPDSADPKTYEVYDAGFSEYSEYAYIPLKVGDNTSKVIYFNDPIREKYWENPHEFWKIDAESTIEFPVTPGSGYRMFVNWVSESENEKFDIALNVNNVKFHADPNDEYSSSSEGGFRELNKTVIYEPKRTVVDFRVPTNTDTVSITLDTNQWRAIKSSEFNGARPLTPRVLSVSGCLLAIETNVIVTPDKTRKIPVYIDTCVEVPWFIPEQIITKPEVLRPISTLNNKYCSDDVVCEDFDDQYIADGPVVAAEELEHFTSFTQGRKRSRIVLLTDSTMVQGQCPHYRDEVYEGNQYFIRSLYPLSPEKYTELGIRDADFTLGDAARKFNFTQKLRAPERGSAAKYYAVSGIQDLTNRYYYNGVLGNLTNYTDGEDDFVPGDVYRRFTPITKNERDQEIENFNTDSISKYGIYPRYSGVFGGEVYLDAPMQGGMPRIYKETGKDYLDWELLNSGGFPGDLFGYSIDIHKDKIVVGTPFSAFEGTEPVSWSGVVASSGLKLSKFGGPGAAYYYERTGRGTNAVSEFLPWEFKQKLKTDTLNVGIDNATSGDLTAQKGGHNLTDQFVEEYASYTDRFGYAVSIDSDFIAVGAPAHDFGSVHDHIYSGTNAFIRKEFNAEFNIPLHKFYDLGSSGNRDLFPDSGKMVLNNGAIFTFRHELTNWFDRTKEWVFAEKIQQEGFSDRNRNLSAVSGSENDFFGKSVSLHRAGRGDSDYVMVGGAPGHNYPTSGNHITLELADAGAAYTYDAMLREQVPSIPNSGSYIDAQVFGSKPDDKGSRLTNTVYQNTSGNSILYTVSGIVFANENGDLFLEVSGYDPSTKSFVAHRPYVESVMGESLDGTAVNNSLNLITSGKPVEMNSAMNLMLSGDPSAIVYNNIDLHTVSLFEQSGNLNLYTSGQVPTENNQTMDLFTSGTITSTDILNLRVRGK